MLRKVHATNPDQKFLALSVSDAAEDVIGVIRGRRGGTSPSRSTAPSSSTQSVRVADGDAVFHHAWQASCSMPSPAASIWRPSMRISTDCRSENARCSA